MARILRYGVRGDDVADFQQNLNRMPSILPQLAADGIYGPKTVRRTQEFQGQHNLVPDGIVGPITWSLFFQILKQLGGPPPPPKTHYDVLRPIVIQIAERCIGKVNFLQFIDNRPKGIDFIKKIFKKVLNIDLTDANFKKKDGSWTEIPIIDGQAKSWCGIFAVYCYREAGIMSVSWDLNSGKPVGSIRIAQWSSNWVHDVKTADIGCVRRKSHHFLIKAVEPGRLQPRIESIDGNQSSGQILEKKIGDPMCHKFDKDNFNYYILK